MDIKRIGEAGQLRSMDTVNGFDVRPGFYLQNGATAIEGGVSFTVHTKNGTACTLSGQLFCAEYKLQLGKRI